MSKNSKNKKSENEKVTNAVKTTKDDKSMKITVLDHIPKGISKKVESIYNKMTPDDEFEIMFFNYKKQENLMGFENFRKILEYLTYRSKAKNLKLENSVTLDVAYTDRSKSKTKTKAKTEVEGQGEEVEVEVADDRDSYRITVSGNRSINKYMEMLHQRKNHVIFGVLLNAMKDDDRISIMKKVKNMDNIVDIDDFNMRVRMSKEIDVSKQEMDNLKKLDETKRNNIFYRYKQRYSLIVEDNSEVIIRVDLTNTKMSNDINRVSRGLSTYELEIDITSKKEKEKLSNKYLDTLYEESTTLLKIFQQSNNLVSRTEELEVLNYYADIVGANKKTMTNLDGRKPVSLEIQHVTDKLPNKYAVTDKADGDRYFLIVYNEKVYLISNNLHVKNTGIVLPKTKSKYNGSILDGELIFLAKNNRHVYMTFDCLFKGTEDVRKESSFMIRLDNADDIITDCFVSKDHKSFKVKQYDGAFDASKTVDYHNKNIDKFMDALNHDVSVGVGKEFPLIRRKYFISVTGAQDNEIFKYSELMWNKYVFDKNTNCPYILDGLVYHPLNQKYTTQSKENKFVEYKWKPVDKNSIDFYITFERDRRTGRVLVLYDNSNEESVRGKPYKIAHLQVGKVSKTGEQPTLFQYRDGKYISKLFLNNGHVRDIEDDIIQDKTVVEFYYNIDPEVPPHFRWVPLRTRYDKTESVQRYNRKYGNYATIADKIWRSIVNPFIIKDISVLANDNMYSKHLEMLRGKVDHSIIMSEAKENVYYQVKNNIGKSLRNFHNRMKDNIIYTYYSPIYALKDKMAVLDIGCGKGGDIMKFYYPRGVALYVGIDNDNYGLVDATDGAISRYNKLRKGHPSFPNMFFINASGGAILEYDSQVKAIGNMSDRNTNLLKKFFSKDKTKRTMFDRINLSFSLHYLLENDIIWNNFLENINMYLKDDGYITFETFDAHQVMKLIDEKGQYTTYYTNNKGEKKVLFEVIKKYGSIKPGEIIKTGNAIDVHNAMFHQEDTYTTEYLVDRRFIEQQFLEKCNLELVDTDIFENQFNIYKDFFKESYKYESVERTRKFLGDVSKFYDQDDEINKASFKLSAVNRYYIFKKVQK